MSGFDAIPHQWWPGIAAGLPKPWPKEARMMDLRWHDAEERIYGRAFPTYEDLMERWGDTFKSVRHRVARVEEWEDPRHPRPRRQAAPKKVGEIAHGQPRGRGRAPEGHLTGTCDTDERHEATDEGQAKGSRGAGEGHPRGHTRGEEGSTLTHTLTHTHTEAAEPPAPAPAGPSCVSPESNQPHTSEAAPGAASQGVRADAVSDGANTAPPTTTETTDGRHDPSERPAADPRPDHEPDAGDPRGPDPDAGGADGAEPGRVGEGQGGARRDGGADLTALWAWMSDERQKALPGTGKITLTPPMRKALRARIGEHGEEGIRTAWTWVLRSGHPRAAFLRSGGFAHPTTFLRPGNCGAYLDLARENGGNPASAAPGATNDHGAGGEATPEAAKAWEVVLRAATDTRYHSGHAPERFSTDPDRDRRVRIALRAAGGWPALCADAGNPWRTRDMRQAFMAAYPVEVAA